MFLTKFPSFSIFAFWIKFPCYNITTTMFLNNTTVMLPEIIIINNETRLWKLFPNPLFSRIGERFTRSIIQFKEFTEIELVSVSILTISIFTACNLPFIRLTNFVRATGCHRFNNLNIISDKLSCKFALWIFTLSFFFYLLIQINSRSKGYLGHAFWVCFDKRAASKFEFITHLPLSRETQDAWCCPISFIF